MGSAAMAAESFSSDPASRRPAISRTTGASAPPNVVHPTTPAVDERRGRKREESAAAFTQPKPQPVMTKISAPMKTAEDPDGTEVTDDQSTSVATRAR